MEQTYHLGGSMYSFGITASTLPLPKPVARDKKKAQEILCSSCFDSLKLSLQVAARKEYAKEK
jgi:hypothetical protein